MIRILNQKERLELSVDLVNLFKITDRKKIPNGLGLMKQAVDDEESVFAIMEPRLGCVAYKVRKSYIKVIFVASLKKGCGRELMCWLEQRFGNKKYITLWASPEARGFYEKLGYTRCSTMGDYRKNLKPV